MQDSFSRYVELTPARSAESGVVVQLEAILNWYARFGHAKRWTRRITDGGSSYFCNEVLSELRRLPVPGVCNADHHVDVGGDRGSAS